MDNNYDQEAGRGDPQARSEQSKSELLKIDTEYFKRGAGIIKLIQLTLGLVLVISQTSPLWFVIPVHAIFMMTSGLTWLYFLGIQRKIRVPFDWNQIEFYCTGGAAVVYAVATVMSFLFFKFSLVVLGSQCTIAYAAGAFLLFESRLYPPHPEENESDAEDV